jgi:RNA polymerase sigma factor for flagellar operon FliA
MKAEYASSTGQDSSRDELLRQHMGLVHHTVERLCGSVVKTGGSWDDLVSAGMMGLVNAFDGFDPDRGIAFSTYAHPRVRGAVLDELRRLDFVPRSVRRKKRAVTRARDAVRARFEGQATDTAVAAEMGIDVPTLRQWELDAERGTSESIDANPLQELAVAQGQNQSWSSETDSIDIRLEREEDVEAVREALARMPEQERLVLILYFYEDLKLRQIGEVIGVSESRVSQIRSRALSRLRKELEMVAA